MSSHSAGCKLPIELWISRRIDGYMNKMYAEALKSAELNVRVVEGDALTGQELMTDLALSMQNVLNHRPYAVKLIALLGTSFDEYMLLDSDNIAVKDPTFLFESKTFVRTGAVSTAEGGCLFFWPYRVLNPTCCRRSCSGRTGFLPGYIRVAAVPVPCEAYLVNQHKGLHDDTIIVPERGVLDSEAI